jgi:hypothetical protein
MFKKFGIIGLFLFSLFVPRAYADVTSTFVWTGSTPYQTDSQNIYTGSSHGENWNCSEGDASLYVWQKDSITNTWSGNNNMCNGQYTFGLNTEVSKTFTFKLCTNPWTWQQGTLCGPETTLDVVQTATCSYGYPWKCSQDDDENGCNAAGYYWIDPYKCQETCSQDHSLCRNQNDCEQNLGSVWNYYNQCVDVCSANSPQYCTTKEDCDSVNRYWTTIYGNSWCNWNCSQDPTLCRTSAECQQATYDNRLWYDNSCHLTMPCSSSFPHYCTTQLTCQTVGGVWWSDSCHSNCSANNLSLCTDDWSCQQASGYWYFDSCHQAGQQSVCDVNHHDLCTDEFACTSHGGFWWDYTCHDTARICSPTDLNNCTAITCSRDAQAYWSTVNGVTACRPWVDFCTDQDVTQCLDFATCNHFNGFWSGGSCAAVICDELHVEQCSDQNSCETAGGSWYDNNCYSNFGSGDTGIEEKTGVSEPNICGYLSNNVLGFNSVFFDKILLSDSCYDPVHDKTSLYTYNGDVSYPLSSANSDDFSSQQSYTLGDTYYQTNWGGYGSNNLTVKFFDNTGSESNTSYVNSGGSFDHSGYTGSFIQFLKIDSSLWILRFNRGANQTICSVGSCEQSTFYFNIPYTAYNFVAIGHLIYYLDGQYVKSYNIDSGLTYEDYHWIDSSLGIQQIFALNGAIYGRNFGPMVSHSGGGWDYTGGFYRFENGTRVSVVPASDLLDTCGQFYWENCPNLVSLSGGNVEYGNKLYFWFFYYGQVDKIYSFDGEKIVIVQDVHSYFTPNGCNGPTCPKAIGMVELSNRLLLQYKPQGSNQDINNFLVVTPVNVVEFTPPEYQAPAPLVNKYLAGSNSYDMTYHCYSAGTFWGHNDTVFPNDVDSQIGSCAANVDGSLHLAVTSGNNLWKVQFKSGQYTDNKQFDISFDYSPDSVIVHGPYNPGTILVSRPYADVQITCRDNANLYATWGVGVLGQMDQKLFYCNNGETKVFRFNGLSPGVTRVKLEARVIQPSGHISSSQFELFDIIYSLDNVNLPPAPNILNTNSGVLTQDPYMTLSVETTTDNSVLSCTGVLDTELIATSGTQKDFYIRYTDTGDSIICVTKKAGRTSNPATYYWNYSPISYNKPTLVTPEDNASGASGTIKFQIGVTNQGLLNCFHQSGSVNDQVFNFQQNVTQGSITDVLIPVSIGDNTLLCIIYNARDKSQYSPPLIWHYTGEDYSENPWWPTYLDSTINYTYSTPSKIARVNIQVDSQMRDVSQSIFRVYCKFNDNQGNYTQVYQGKYQTPFMVDYDFQQYGSLEGKDKYVGKLSCYASQLYMTDELDSTGHYIPSDYGYDALPVVQYLHWDDNVVLDQCYSNIVFSNAPSSCSDAETPDSCEVTSYCHWTKDSKCEDSDSTAQKFLREGIAFFYSLPIIGDIFWTNCVIYSTFTSDIFKSGPPEDWIIDFIPPKLDGLSALSPVHVNISKSIRDFMAIFDSQYPAAWATTKIMITTILVLLLMIKFYFAFLPKDITLGEYAAKVRDNFRHDRELNRDGLERFRDPHGESKTHNVVRKKGKTYMPYEHLRSYGGRQSTDRISDSGAENGLDPWDNL